MCDAHYRFTVIDIGAHGREGDAGIFQTSTLRNALLDRSLDLPGHKVLPGSDRVLPHVIVADEAFPLMGNLLRPFPGRGKGGLPLLAKVYNYR